MKKTLIALALTALPVAAMADVVLYGQIKGGMGVTFGDSDTREGTITQMEDYGSRIGFKGEEDLGNGLKAIWQVEQYVSLAGGSDKTSNQGWNTRDTFIGLEGGFGKVRAGYVSDQFNENMETMDIWEYRTGAGKAARGLATMTRFDTRQQGVRYDSPNFGGFDFNITHQLADSAGEGEFNRPLNAQDQATIVGLNYENSGFFGKLGYGFYKRVAASRNDKNQVNMEDGHLVRVEGGYDANNLFVGLAYQYAKDMPAYSAWAGGDVALENFAGTGKPQAADKAHEAAVSVAYTMGAITPKFTYAHGWDQKISGEKVKNSGYDQVIIGADYALSKRTTALVSAGWMSTTDGSVDKRGEYKDEDLYSVGVGLRHKF